MGPAIDVALLISTLCVLKGFPIVSPPRSDPKDHDEELVTKLLVKLAEDGAIETEPVELNETLDERLKLSKTNDTFAVLEETSVSSLDPNCKLLLDVTVSCRVPISNKIAPDALRTSKTPTLPPIPTDNAAPDAFVAEIDIPPPPTEAVDNNRV